MKSSYKQLLVATLVAGFGAIASAQTPPPGGPGGPGMGGPGMHHQHGGDHQMGRFDPARMQEHMARREAMLKQKLQITPAQEPAFNAFAAAMRPPANWKRPDRGELQKLPTPERIDRMRALRAERNAMMDKRADATKAFYATLTPYQKGAFDSIAMHGGGHRGHGGGHGGPGRHGG